LVLVLLLVPFARVAASTTCRCRRCPQQDVDALLATLEDPAARQAIQQLKALKAVRPAAQTVEPEGLGAILLSSLSERVRDERCARDDRDGHSRSAERRHLGRKRAGATGRVPLAGRAREIGITLFAALAVEWLALRLGPARIC
jgi:DNA-binding transcriptional ArsR family regulator